MNSVLRILKMVKYMDMDMSDQEPYVRDVRYMDGGVHHVHIDVGSSCQYPYHQALFAALQTFKTLPPLSINTHMKIPMIFQTFQLCLASGLLMAWAYHLILSKVPGPNQ